MTFFYDSFWLNYLSTEIPKLYHTNHPPYLLLILEARRPIHTKIYYLRACFEWGAFFFQNDLSATRVIHYEYLIKATPILFANLFVKLLNFCPLNVLHVYFMVSRFSLFAGLRTISQIATRGLFKKSCFSFPLFSLSRLISFQFFDHEKSLEDWYSVWNNYLRLLLEY